MIPHTLTRLDTSHLMHLYFGLWGVLDVYIHYGYLQRGCHKHTNTHTERERDSKRHRERERGGKKMKEEPISSWVANGNKRGVCFSPSHDYTIKMNLRLLYELVTYQTVKNSKSLDKVFKFWMTRTLD